MCHHRYTEDAEIIFFFSFAGKQRQRKTNLSSGRFIIGMIDDISGQVTDAAIHDLDIIPKDC
jgi:hypothetical protein